MVSCLQVASGELETEATTQHVACMLQQMHKLQCRREERVLSAAAIMAIMLAFFWLKHHGNGLQAQQC